MKNIFLFTVVGIALLLQISSCKKDEIPPIPELTPESSFSMDFSDFQQNKSAGFLPRNWAYSALNVAVFSTIVTANMTIPTLAFNKSFDYTPSYIGNQTWQWSYEFVGIGTTYYAKLNGTVNKNNVVDWEMYIDKTGINSFENFLWFEGTTTDSTKAIWTVYENPDDPSALFDIEWNANADHSVSNLKYTYLSSGSDNINSTIEFGKENGTTLDRYYNISLTSTDALINIEWNSLSKNGRVKSPDFYFSDDWHCWDETLNDTWCD